MLNISFANDDDNNVSYHLDFDVGNVGYLNIILANVDVNVKDHFSQ
jgi:hypothetical protein